MNLDELDLSRLLRPYNPWHSEPEGAWRKTLPAFERPVLKQLCSDLDALTQIISITGPRRVGKTTVLRQLVCHLLDERRVSPEQIIYFSFDDPAKGIIGKVEHGWVTLLGEVDFERQRTAVEESVSHIDGVRGVVNMITVKHDSGETVDRDRITA